MQKTTLSTVGSLATAIVASLCCIGPAVLAIAGAGSLGAFAAFEKYRPYFIGLTAILLGLAFYLTYRRREVKCEDGSCKIEGAGKWNKLGVWSATIIAVLAISYPYLAAKPSATTNAAFTPKAAVVLEVKGMTCTACASHIQTALSEVKGVHRASVEYETGKGVVEYDPGLVQPEALIKRIVETGYKATVAQENKGE
ncbi:MAG: mercuric transporter MerT family protein [candidate division KSB1 bacterium]|nr:mercuric transporter MerT family protein [candidate division KSB1 bacterium]MDZ7304868.1 mercuric transporter MerT family protein [candidate division KSB1 bacterium]MDZ7314121.1 mercuric transporter MerT family protein [candidate division KSB1 bacterium]